MRAFLAFALFATACTNAPGGSPAYDSVRERLHDGPTRLYVGAEASTGSLTARRWTPAGWVEGDTAVTIESGELSATVDDRGTLKLDKLVVALAPIDVPEQVFKKPAQLTDVTLTLTTAAEAETQWTSDDDATATLALDLDFDWAITIDGAKTPLGTQHLPPVTIDLSLAGGGDHVDASIALVAEGQLWNWADLLQMTALELTLTAETLD